MGGTVASDTQPGPGEASEFEKIADMARAEGGIHHRFGIGDRFVVIVDGWASAEHSQRSFAQPDLQAFVGSVGADLAPPEITLSEAISSLDQF